MMSEFTVCVLRLYMFNFSKNDTFIVNKIIYNYMLGPPDPPYNVNPVKISAHTTTITWKSGHSGGSTQTFQVHHKAENKDSYTVSETIADPGADRSVNYTLTGLLEGTMYSFKVLSTYKYRGNNQAESSLMDFTTPGMWIEWSILSLHYILIACSI